MENGGNPYSDHSNNSSSRPQINTANANPVWDLWCPNSSRFDWTNATAVSLSNAAASTPGETSASTHPEAPSSQALMFTHHSLHNHHHFQQLTLYGGEGSHLAPDPHLMCLKLGKRHYFEDSFNFPLGEREVAGFSGGKRGKHYYSTEVGSHVGPSSTATVPRCQVEGCHVSLVNAKDYHRRHKVCEMHSKAPKVIVLGLEQRFCQQCSRFHVVSEFDESKRSCRRRLAGHNERRRKSAQDSISRNSSHEKLIGGKFPCIASTTGHALSLLSLKASDSWTSSSDLSSRSSAALRELIAEHRAAILSRHVHYNSMEDHLGDQSQPSSNNIVSYQNQNLPDPHNHWDRFQDSGMQAVTLDLMQAPASAFGFLPTRPKSKEEEEEEEECCELWNTWAGAQQV